MKSNSDEDGMFTVIANWVPRKDRASFVAATQMILKTRLTINRALAIFLAGLAYVVCRRLQDFLSRDGTISQKPPVDLVTHVKPSLPRQSVALAVGGMIVATAIIGAYFWGRSDTRELRKIAENPAAYAEFAKYSMEAVRTANSNAKASAAVACLLNIPDARVTLQNSKLVVVVPNYALTIRPGDSETTISLEGDSRRMMQLLQGSDVLTHVKEAEKQIR